MRGISYTEQLALLNNNPAKAQKNTASLPEPMSSNRQEIVEIPYGCESALLQREIKIHQQKMMMSYWFHRSAPYFGIKDNDLTNERVKGKVQALIHRNTSKTQN